MKKIILVVCIVVLMATIGCRADITEVSNEVTAEIIESPKPTVKSTPVVKLKPVETPFAPPVTPPVVSKEPEPEYNIVIVEDEVIALAKMAWGEARGCSIAEIAGTMWVALNRVDTTGYGMGGTIEYVISFPEQFTGYSTKNPVTDELYELAVDVLTRWQMEKQGASVEEVGRVIPKEYLFFHGDGEHNWFRIPYEHDGKYWGWSLPNPYEESGE